MLNVKIVGAENVTKELERAEKLINELHTIIYRLGIIEVEVAENRAD